MPEDIEDESVVVEVETTGEEEQDTRAQVSSNDDGDELDSYSKNVQTRIKKLTEKYRNEERVRTEAERLYQQVLAENQQLKGRVQNLDKGYLNEFGGRLEGQIESAKRLYREAHDSGDVDAMLAAQDQLNRMGIEQERLRIAKQRADVQQPERQQYVTQQQTQQAAPQAKPDPKAQSWAEKNEWFGTDEVMTYAAFGIHRKLVEEEGFDPQSEEYYSEVNRRMRTEFPHRFAGKKSGGTQVASAVSSASRSTAKQGRRSVKLSPSQIAIAKRLGVPLEEYAKYVKD